jgi:hypothetical protein
MNCRAPLIFDKEEADISSIVIAASIFALGL